MHCLTALLALCSAVAPPQPLAFDPEKLTLSARVADRAVLVLRGLSYAAHWAEGRPAFQTLRVASAEPRGENAWHLSFALEGPSSADATVEADARLLGDRCLRLEWRVSYTGEERPFFGWTDGVRFDLAEQPSAARTRPLLRWVSPTGARDWEVAGDTPYPDLDRQLRDATLGDLRLVVLADWYDPDWFYERNLGRVPFHRLRIPATAPQQARATLEILVAPPEARDEDLLAAARDEPFGVALTTGREPAPARAASLFAPGEELTLEARVANVAPREQQGRLTWELWDYYGRRLASGNEPVRLAGLAETRLRLVPERTRARRGIYFLAGRLAWQGGERALRTTLAVLPERPAPAVDESSPFGMAQITANPARYPDQPDLATVLALCARIGVHWIRGFGFPVRDEVDPQAVQRSRDDLQALESHGIHPHVQCGYPMPTTEDEALAFREAFAASLEQYKFLSRYIEVGNEYNFSTKPDAYVNLLLRHQFDVMRRVFPEGRVMNMGLGGVARDWWQGFLQAGGLQYLDILSVHPGHHPRAPEFWEGWDGWVFRPQMARAFGGVEALGPDRRPEVWITEAYSPSGPTRTWLDVRMAADYLVREHCLALALGVRVIEWYRFQDGTWFSSAPRPDDGEFSYGVVYTDLSPKPQYVAYGAMTEQLEGKRCLGRLDLGADDLYGVRFQDADGGFLDVLWSYRERHECDLGLVAARELQGQASGPGRALAGALEGTRRGGPARRPHRDGDRHPGQQPRGPAHPGAGEAAAVRLAGLRARLGGNARPRRGVAGGLALARPPDPSSACP